MAPRKDTFQPIELPADCVVYSKFPGLWAFTHAGVGCVDEAVLGYFYSDK